QYGVPYTIIIFSVISALWYAIHRVRKAYKSEHNYKPNLCFRGIVGLILIILLIHIPIGIEIYKEWDKSVRPTSYYDTYYGPYFTPNASGLVYNSIPGVPSAHCSSLIYLQNGDLLCTWYAGSYEKATDVAIWMSRCHPNMTGEGSLDLDWSEPEIVADTVNRSEGQPSFYQCPNGRIYLFFQTLTPSGPVFGDWGPDLVSGWSYATIKYQYSDDNGYTWSTPEFLRDFYLWTLRNPAVLTKEGHVVLPVEMEGTSHFLINEDPDLDGTWQKYARLRISSSLTQPCITELENGKLMSVFRTQAGLIYKSYSNDGGYSWKKPIPMRFPNPDSCVFLTTLADQRTLILGNIQSNNRNTLSFILGDETGQYWSEPSPVKNHTSRSYSYPCMVRLRDDSIVYSYTNNRWNIGWGRFTPGAVDHMQILYG
ncbi:MAG: hypothetical protein GF364_12050, partial [Candidatus Lokiarchaeota archaeon]|nr:hypothetical protein [Candidatus Lokiarchaeota archaeon]